MGDFLALTLTEAADAVARGDVSSVTLTAACLERLRALGPKLNCVASIESDAVLETAEQLDKERKAGRLRGKLHGVPLAHKDLFYRKGKVVACGSLILRDFVPDTTATALERLNGAGALNLGSLHMAEFAFSPTGYNKHYGHCRNPWNPDHVSGGSSSGSAAAVAARLVFGSLGTDSGGSIRHPAAMCGVTGLKPTQTRVSRAGVMPLSFSLDCVSPIARTARDCARLLAAIAGKDDADPTAADREVPEYESGLSGDMRGLKIAVPRKYYYDCVTAEVGSRLESSLAVFTELGAQIVPADVPDMTLVNSLAQMVMGVEAATAHGRWLRTRREDYGEIVRSRIEPGLLYPATRYCEALAMRAGIAKEFLDSTLNRADVVHLPAIPIPVPAIESTTRGDPASIAKTLGDLTHCTRGINFLGLPAISVPAGFTANGLPCAFQLVGRPFSEGLLLRVADAYQRLTDWHKKTPPLH
jgi:aspartyl-tRNA(Asn)/glutamyl-tRNA(Gln) amidotransferase subunit A